MRIFTCPYIHCKSHLFLSGRSSDRQECDHLIRMREVGDLEIRLVEVPVQVRGIMNY